MERLTKRELINGKHVGCNIEISQMNSCPDCNDSCMYGTCKWQEKANQKLKEYEDLEEQNLLLKLPCAVNDIVYLLMKNTKKIRRCQVEQFNVRSFCITLQIFIFEDMRSVQIDADRFGELVFLTKEEAEKALEEMKE